MLRNMVINLSKGDHFGASNQVQLVNSNCERLKEEEIVQHLPVDIKIPSKTQIQ
jgi:hypothetical protein